MLAPDSARSVTVTCRAENSVGAGSPSDKQTIKTLEEAPEGPPRDIIVRAQGPQTIEISWKVRQEIIYMVFTLAHSQHISPH